MPLSRLEELADTIRHPDRAEPCVGATVVVGLASCSLAAGAGPVYDTLKRDFERSRVEGVSIRKAGCIGLCYLEPLVQVRQGGAETVTYARVDAERAHAIFQRHICGGAVQTQWAVPPEAVPAPHPEGVQLRIVLRNCGVIDPESIDDYVHAGGYRALATVLASMSPADVVKVVRRSGLRGRGGGGFPTGIKWELCLDAQADEKYVLCNAGEGDPGGFLSRCILEGDPYAILEAMTIGGYAIGARQGYIHVRADYSLAIQRVQTAIAEARRRGLLGDGVLGSGFSFDISLKRGVGGFVSGEETALFQSVDGRRPMPRPRPPFPAEAGLYGKPTLVNSVETWANIPPIINNGADWFAGIGTPRSKGTKVVGLAGKVSKPGLVEVPMGTTIRRVIEEAGGGVRGGKTLKAVHVGGPAGGCLPAGDLDVPLDYDALGQAGAALGTGVLVVMDEGTCMVDVARYFLEFAHEESCGKCAPCREGTQRMLEIATRITRGQGRPGDVQKLERLGETIRRSSLCGLGRSAPNPVLSTITRFPDEYHAHVVERRCPAHVCNGLLSYQILEERCLGCGICLRNCPVSAVVGEPGQPHRIKQDRCIRCGECARQCGFEAVVLR